MVNISMYTYIYLNSLQSQKKKKKKQPRFLSIRRILKIVDLTH